MAIFGADREEATACQEATEVFPEKMEPNPGEKEVVMECQEIPHEEASVYSLRVCQETRKARLECEEPSSVDTEYVAVHEVPKVDAAVKPVDGRRKRRRDRNLAAERRQKPKETPGDRE
jgi:hypothetical protein